MVKLTSYNPAKLLNLDKGEIKEGKIADLTIYDPEGSYIYTKRYDCFKIKRILLL